MPRPEPLELFDWLRVLATAQATKVIGAQAGAIAIYVALSSKGTTGTEATVDATALAIRLDLSERQVWRHFARLRDSGWFTQTSWPTRGADGERGRKARYRLTNPSVEVSHDPTESSDTNARADVTREPLSPDGLDPNRLTLSAESSDVAEREVGTVTPSVGPPSVGSPAGHPSTATTGRERAAS